MGNERLFPARVFRTGLPTSDRIRQVGTEASQFPGDELPIRQLNEFVDVHRAATALFLIDALEISFKQDSSNPL
jgi:hypothetical protein